MNQDWEALESQYYAFTVKRQPIVLVKGKGMTVWDNIGNEYLDFTAGWAVNSLGHCHPEIVKAINDQSTTLIQTSNQFYTIPQIKLAQILVDNSCLDKVFLCNSGAEANEGALKLARKYGKKHKNGAYAIITANNSFHGRTTGTLAATGQPRYQEPFQPLQPGFTHVEFNNVKAIMEATTEDTVAVMLEPIQGEGGVNIPSADYFKKVREWCDLKGLLLILDEVQTGIGRLGTLFGYENYGVEPDVITLAKGLGGGVPIGAFLSKTHCMSLEPGDHGSTFGGNPLVSAAAFACVSHIMDNNILNNVTNMGEKLVDCLKVLQSRFSCISEIRGKGLLIAVEFGEDIAGKVLALCNEEGVLFNLVKPNAIRIMPPLNISQHEINEGMARLEQALRKL